MYAIGSKVVHPGHGAGTIIDIQEKSLGETSRTYYVIDTISGVAAGSKQLMVPVRHAEDAGLRAAGRAARLRAILDRCELPADDDVDKDYRTRQVAMRELLNSGSFKNVATAVCTLYYLHTQRPLGMTDRQLLEHGKGILASELAVASDTDLDDAMHEIEDRLATLADEQQRLLEEAEEAQKQQEQQEQARAQQEQEQAQA